MNHYNTHPHDREPIFEKYELQNDQVDFLYKLLELWDAIVEEPYYEYCETISKVIEKGYYNDEEQFEIEDMIKLYKGNLIKITKNYET